MGSSKIFVAVDQGSGDQVWSGCRLAVCTVDVSLLFPHLASVRVERVDTRGDPVLIAARTREGPAACPGCGAVSEHEHSRYVRHVADRGVGSRVLLIELSVRRLYCANPDCARGTSVEQVPGLTERYQRRTPGLGAVVEAVGVALAGRAGSRLLMLLGVALSWMRRRKRTAWR